MAASIAQEFYKVREEWARADKLKSWRLAVWVTEFQDIDIVDKFLETERLPVGIFDDIFFRFDTEYTGDNASFEEALWKEYMEWFAPPPPQAEKYDMLKALKDEEIVTQDFAPQSGTGFEALTKELLRFKANIKRLEKDHFCLYFPPNMPEKNMLRNWLSAKLEKGIPDGIRLITIDYATNRKIVISNNKIKGQIIEITPHLNMKEAISNEMDKGGGSSNTVTSEDRYRRQIRIVMESTIKQNKELTGSEVKTMLSLSKQIGSSSALIASLLVASQAHFTIKDNEQSEAYATEAITKAEKAMAEDDPAGYPTWKSCMMLKGALLTGKRKWGEAIAIYDKLAETATTHADAFFVLEGYRISGHLHFRKARLQKAFEKLLLALTGGSYLEKNVIRQSTFLDAAYLALHIAEKIKKQDEVQIVKDQLRDWMGDDYEELLAQGDMENVLLMPKRKFSVLPGV